MDIKEHFNDESVTLKLPEEQWGLSDLEDELGDEVEMVRSSAATSRYSSLLRMLMLTRSYNRMILLSWDQTSTSALMVTVPPLEQPNTHLRPTIILN